MVYWIYLREFWLNMVNFEVRRITPYSSIFILRSPWSMGHPLWSCLCWSSKWALKQQPGVLPSHKTLLSLAYPHWIKWLPQMEIIKNIEYQDREAENCISTICTPQPNSPFINVYLVLWDICLKQVVFIAVFSVSSTNMSVI